MKFLASILAAACLIGIARAAWRADRYADDVGCPHDAIRFSRPQPRNSWLPSISPGWPLRTGKWSLTWQGKF